MFESEHVEGLLDDRGGEVLLVTFNHMGMLASGSDFWGRAVAARLGISALGLMSRRRNWHPAAGYRGAEPLAEALRQRFRVVILYGFSQGAYAAIRHSGLFRADHVLAFSPQASIDPARIGSFDRRFGPYFDPDLHHAMEPRADQASGRILLFHDPWSRDRRHADLIAAKVAVEYVPMPFIGHASVKAVASRPALAALLEAVLANRTAGEITRLLTPGRRAQPVYFENLARTLVNRGRRKLACRVLATAGTRGVEDASLTELARKLGPKAPPSRG